MPSLDVLQLVRTAIEKNREIPAVLDAYGEFIDSPIGPLELQNLGEIFAQILENLSQRFPEAASKRAAKVAHDDIAAFLLSTNNDVDRLKDVMKSQLSSVSDAMVQSIGERFRRMNNEERRAIDATLRIIRRSKEELLFKADAGKQLSTAGQEFQRFFALIKAQAHGMTELRYENLIVEKAIFNKLILKSKAQDYRIWVPSYFARENADKLIEKVGLGSEHILLARLDELQSQGNLTGLEPFLKELEDNNGLVPKDQKEPAELSDLFQTEGDYRVLPPLELDDVTSFFDKRRRATEETSRAEEKKKKEEIERIEQERKNRESARKKSTVIEAPVNEPQNRPASENSVYLGKRLDFDQFLGALNRRVPDKEFANQVKEIGDFYFDAGQNDIGIVGSSGTGKSTTLKRILDGLAGKPVPPRIIVIDQKGEHRGIAWKYDWKVFAIAADTQASELKVSLVSNKEDDSRLLSDLIQQWLLQSGLNCSDQQKERISSVIRSFAGPQSLDTLSDALLKEQELAQIGQKLKKNFGSKNPVSRMLSGSGTISPSALVGSALFDISGRGMKDPTSKEEREMISVLILRDIAASGIQKSIIVIEDVLDRFKVGNLKLETIHFLEKLRMNGNKVVLTSRSETSKFLSPDRREFLHRIFGDKVVSEELAIFSTNIPKQTLANVVGYLPRGFLISSTQKSSTEPSAAVRVEQMQFAKAEV